MQSSYNDLLRLFLSHLENYTREYALHRPIELYAPQNYILNLGGKRIRPLLALIACDALGAAPEKALNTALAVELFHNFSLIHDDILDEAPLRRNQETVHKKWNTNIAILSGDAMMVKAFEVLQKESANLLPSLLSIFTKTAIEVCEGQQWDMNFENMKDVSVPQYIHMITNKTAVLLGCSLQMGAICANATIQQQETIYNFGKHLGIAFQLLDDLLDTYADDPEKFGKQVGGDILANKKTFLVLKAFEVADASQKQYLQEAMQLPTSAGDTKIKAVKQLFDALNVKSLLQKEADTHTALAITNLNNLNLPKDKQDDLHQLAFDLLNRKV
jgi:geranylgeranyl diphosphate synthase, type II